MKTPMIGGMVHNPSAYTIYAYLTTFFYWVKYTELAYICQIYHAQYNQAEQLRQDNRRKANVDGGIL